MRVPQFDLSRAVEIIRPQLEQRWSALLDRTAFVGGPEVAEFEQAFADYLQIGGCVGVANGTDAIELALMALDLQPGDEVVVPAYTFVATAGAVVLAGGRPVFVDVEAGTLNIDPQAIAAAVTERTAGVIGVHLYGQPFNVAAVVEVCERHGIWLIEDAAQAHGATVGGKSVGSFGRLTTWSFYPSKNLGTFGDGGAISADDPELLARVRRLTNHGRSEHFTHDEAGRNSRLDALQAAVLNCRLPLLDADNRRRTEIAAAYRAALGEVDAIEFLSPAEGDCPVYHQMTLLSAQRDALREHLGAAGVGTAIHYPTPVDRQAAYAPWAVAGATPVAAAAAETVLCLPMFPQLTDEEVALVCAEVLAFFG